MDPHVKPDRYKNINQSSWIIINKRNKNKRNKNERDKNEINENEINENERDKNERNENKRDKNDNIIITNTNNTSILHTN